MAEQSYGESLFDLGVGVPGAGEGIIDLIELLKLPEIYQSYKDQDAMMPVRDALRFVPNVVSDTATFVGDLLYEGFMGDGWGAALDKLKGAVGGIFKAIAGAGEAVINFFKDGFGRLIENFPTVPIPDFRPGDIVANLLMKFPGGLDILGLEVPKWVPFIGGASVIGFLQGLPGLQEVLGFFAQFMPGMDRYIEGG